MSRDRTEAFTQWSIQIKYVSYTKEQISEVIPKLGNDFVFVEHTYSYKTRKNVCHHIHAYVRTEPLKIDQFNGRIKALLPKLNGRNGEYSTTDPKSFADALAYFMLERDHQYKKYGMTLLGNSNLTEAEMHLIKEYDEMALNPRFTCNELVYASPTDIKEVNVGKVVSKKSDLDKQMKFYDYCKEYFSDESEDITYETIALLLWDYFSKVGWKSETAYTGYVYYAMSNLLKARGESPGGSYDLARRRFASRLADKCS